ncbi:M15 family metallopeptidase [Bacillus sp. V2I10]|uniref:M15 family metallopeptidase n=1 Tax=Bacillus sp. V2I10 TaxID=3042276 RepID=UPI00359364D7
MRSYHIVGQALDFVPVNNKGVCLWDGYESDEIKKAISYAKRLGFSWGGDWTSL